MNRTGGSRGSLAMARGYQGSQTVVVPGTTGVSATVPGNVQALLSANFEEPDTYTVQFNIAAPSILPIPTPTIAPANWPASSGIIQPTATFQGIRCVAIVSWKVEGVQVKRVLDVSNGVSISGTAQSVDVQVQDVTYSVAGTGAQAYTVSATVTRGVRASTSLPPVLYSSNLSIPGGGGGIVLPIGNIDGTLELLAFPDAGIVSMEVVAVQTAPADNLPPADFWVSQYNGLSLVKTYAPLQISDFVKVVPGTTRVQLRENTAGTTVNATLSWGIDG